MRYKQAVGVMWRQILYYYVTDARSLTHSLSHSSLYFCQIVFLSSAIGLE